MFLLWLQRQPSRRHGIHPRQSVVQLQSSKFKVQSSASIPSLVLRARFIIHHSSFIIHWSLIIGHWSLVIGPSLPILNRDRPAEITFKKRAKQWIIGRRSRLARGAIIFKLKRDNCFAIAAGRD